MKKETERIFNILGKNVKNAFTNDEAGQKAAEAILELVKAMIEDTEKEFTLDDLKGKIDEAIQSLAVPTDKDIEEKVHNAIEVKFKAIANVAGKTTISKEVKNQAARAILSAHSAEEVENALAEVAKKNGINGLTFADVVDYSLADKFGNENALFAKFRKVEVNKFFYVAEDMSVAAALAKQHVKGAAKDIQTLTAVGKEMTPKMVFKIQEIDIEDLLRLKKAGREAALVAWVTEELRRVLTNTEVMAILVGDTVNPEGKRVTSFETIKKEQSDLFTIVKTSAKAFATIDDVREALADMYNPGGFEVVAVANAKTFNSMSKHKVSEGADNQYYSDTDLAGQMGVDTLYRTNLMGDGEVILVIPEEYYVHNEGEIEVVYDRMEANKHFMQYERLDCGAIRGLLSTAYIKPTVA